MLFTNYTDFELNIFNSVKKYFEKLPPFASDDYKNGFLDLVSQFGARCNGFRGTRPGPS